MSIQKFVVACCVTQLGGICIAMCIIKPSLILNQGLALLG